MGAMVAGTGLDWRTGKYRLFPKIRPNHKEKNKICIRAIKESKITYERFLALERKKRVFYKYINAKQDMKEKIGPIEDEL